MEHYQEYLTLLNDLTTALAQLTDTAHEKSAAVRQDDLAALNDVIKREQALSLTLRGCEQKRQALLSRLGLDGVSLSTLADQYPPALRPTARAAADALRRQFLIFRSAADTARNLLEGNLHQIEQYLNAAEDRSFAPGYAHTTADAQLPPPLRSDFRA